jgi:hypothetical protein
MIETITERLNEQVEWLDLHGKNPVRIELGKLAYRRMLLESMSPVFGFDPGNQPVEWQGLDVAVSDNPLDPWRAFVCCYEDPTESQ